MRSSTPSGRPPRRRPTSSSPWAPPTSSPRSTRPRSTPSPARVPPPAPPRRDDPPAASIGLPARAAIHGEARRSGRPGADALLDVPVAYQLAVALARFVAIDADVLDDLAGHGLVGQPTGLGGAEDVL